MTRVASILLALLCLFTAAYAGQPDGRHGWVSVRSCEQTVITTEDGNFHVVHEFFESRRSKKTVTRKTTANGNTAITREDIYFVWDDWNLIYERHENQFGMLLWDREYHWGEDLAGGTTGADGVGGAGALLLIRDRRDFKRQLQVDHYPCYDTSGNVIALTDTSGTITARYDHGPFGEPLLATGPAANSNPIRWASKYYDAETGFYYFGKRYYDPRTAQWLTREPLGESASLNLYSYCHNDPINKTDILGLAEAALDGDKRLTAFGTGLVVVARDNPGRAIAMLLESQIQRETAALRIGADFVAARADVSKAVDSALLDTRKEWRWLATEAGIGADVYRHLSALPGFDSVVERVWSDTVPLLMAATVADAENRARSADLVAHQNSAAYKVPEILRGAEYAFRELALFNSFTRGTCGVEFAPGFTGMDDSVTAGGRAFAFGEMALVAAPMLRGGSFIDDFARAGVRGRAADGGVVFGMPGARQIGNAQIVRTVGKGESVSGLINEGKALTWMNEVEYGLVSLTNGQRVLLSGGRDGIRFLQPVKGGPLFIRSGDEMLQVRRVLGHTHPSPTGPSQWDIDALGILKQSKSYLIEIGGNGTTVIRLK